MACDRMAEGGLGTPWWRHISGQYRPVTFARQASFKPFRAAAPRRLQDGLPTTGPGPDAPGPPDLGPTPESPFYDRMLLDQAMASDPSMQDQVAAPAPSSSGDFLTSPDGSQDELNPPPQPAPVYGPKAPDALTRLQNMQSAAPQLSEPKWWQRALGAAAGFGAGWSNAADRTKRPIDVNAMEQGILEPGYQSKLAAWQSHVAPLQTEANIEKQRQQLAEEAAQSGARVGEETALGTEALSRAGHYKEMSGDTLASRKYAADERTLQQLLKAHPDADYQKATDPVPPGYMTIPDLHNPNYVYVAPGPRALTQDLAPYAPGYEVGQNVPWTAFQKAQAAKQAEDRVVAAAKAKTTAPKELSPEQEIPDALLHPEKYGADVVQRARNLWSQEHRDPNAAGAGPGTLPIRNPAIPPDQRDEGVFAGTPAGVQSVVKQLVDYKYPLPTGIALSKPYWQNVMQLAAQYDPSFDASQYANRQSLRRSFMSGQGAQAINSLNTVTDHVDRLEKNWAALGNTGILPGLVNAPLNWMESGASGNFQKRLNSFKLDQDAVSNELMRVWRQVGANEAEVKAWSQKLSPNLSPAAQQGAIQELYGLINGKLHALKSQYEVGMGKPADFKMLQPATAARFKAHGIDASDLAPNATYRANAQPGQGAPAGALAVEHWGRDANGKPVLLK